MLRRVIIILEILTIIIGLYRVHNKKLNINIPNAALFIILLFVLELVNFRQIPAPISNINIIIIYFFALYEFKDTVSNTIINMGLSLSIISVVQFIGIVLSGLFVSVEAIYKNLVAGIISLLITVIVLPLLNVHKIRESILKRHWLKFVIVLFMVSIFSLMLMQGKMLKGISIESYLFVIPAIIIILFLMIFWDKSISAEKQLKEEMDTVLAMQDNYEGLLEKVRANQHDFKNHLLALVATQYTYKTYDQLAKAQNEYCGIMEADARYNDLLKIQNRTLGGFLYGKMLEIESKDILFQYSIKTTLDSIEMPYYYLIEILGIFIDNAIEATSEYSGKRIIYIGIEKCQSSYKISIRNTYREITYSEIMSWFELGKTTKIHSNGIGLYQANKLCQEWNCDLIYQCINIEEQDWIQFEINVKRKEE